MSQLKLTYSSLMPGINISSVNVPAKPIIKKPILNNKVVCQGTPADVATSNKESNIAFCTGE